MSIILDGQSVNFPLRVGAIETLNFMAPGQVCFTLSDKKGVTKLKMKLLKMIESLDQLVMAMDL